MLFFAVLIPHLVSGVVQFTRSPQSVTVKEGVTVILPCSAIGSPSPVIHWRKGAQSRLLTAEANGSLVLPFVKKTDEGYYICVATGGNDTKEVSAFVSVNYRFNPFIAIGPINETVAEGSVVTFQCVVVGRPSPAIIWQKQTGDFPADKAVINANGSLTVSNLVKSDSGFYECLASNFHSVAKARAYLRVLDPIMFLKKPTNQKPSIGGTVLLECEIDSSGTPATITWLKDNVPLNFTSKIRLLPLGSLTISSLIREDMGYYTCQANGAVGRVETSATIILPGAMVPQFLSIPQDATVNLNDDLGLLCEATGLPTPTILWKKDGKSLASIETLSNPKRYTSTNGRLTIAQTIYEDAGVYTCIANNIVGNSQATVTVTIRASVIPSKPASLQTQGPSNEPKKNDYGWPGWFEWNIVSVGIASLLGGLLLMILFVITFLCYKRCNRTAKPKAKQSFSAGKQMTSPAVFTPQMQGASTYAFPNPRFEPEELPSGNGHVPLEADQLSFNSDEFEYDEEEGESDEEPYSSEESYEDETEESSIQRPPRRPRQRASERRPTSHPNPDRNPISKKKVSTKEVWDYRHSSASQYPKAGEKGAQEYDVSNRLHRLSKGKAQGTSTTLNYSRRHSSQAHQPNDHDMSY